MAVLIYIPTNSKHLFSTSSLTLDLCCVFDNSHSDKCEVISHYGLVYIIFSEKAMAPHSSTLAWKIPWTKEPGRLQFMGSRRVGHD